MSSQFGQKRLPDGTGGEKMAIGSERLVRIKKAGESLTHPPESAHANCGGLILVNRLGIAFAAAGFAVGFRRAAV